MSNPGDDQIPYIGDTPSGEPPLTPRPHPTSSVHNPIAPNTASQFSAVRSDDDYGAYLQEDAHGIAQPQARQHNEGRSGRRSDEDEHEGWIPSPSLEDRADPIWMVYGIERADRRQVLHAQALQCVIEAVEGSGRDIPERSEQWDKIFIATLKRVAKRYADMRDLKSSSRASTPMAAVLTITPSIMPTLSRHASSRTSSPNNADQLRDPMTVIRSSPNIESARAHVDAPRRVEETETDYQRRWAASQRLRDNDTQRAQSSGGEDRSRDRIRETPGNIPTDENGLVYPFVTMRTPKATIMKDRIAYQRLRREDIKNHGSSMIDDQRINLEGTHPTDMDAENEIEEIKIPRNDQHVREHKRETVIPATSRQNTPASVKPPVRFEDDYRIRDTGERMVGPGATSGRGYSMPRILGPRHGAPGVSEALDRHKSSMEQRLIQLIHEALGVRIVFPDGFKFNQKLDSIDKYSGSAKFADLENWLSKLVYKLAVRQIGGNDLDRLRLLITGEHLEGEAQDWYIRHVLSVNRSKFDWTFEGVILALYNRFVHPSTMQDAREGFRKAKYSSSLGVQTFYDILMDFAQNMAVYPDEYSIIEVFLDGIPKDMRTELIRIKGLSPEVNSLEDFVAFAKEYETRTKTNDYYNRRSGGGITYVAKETTGVDKQRIPLRGRMRVLRSAGAPLMGGAKPLTKEQNQVGDKPAHKLELKDRPRVDREIARRNTSTGPKRGPRNGNCFNCDDPNHFSRDCPHPRKDGKVHLRAARTANASETEDTAESNCEDECEACLVDAEAEGSDEYTDVEVEWYESDDASDFICAMDTKDFVSTFEDKPKNDAEAVMRRVRLKTSKKDRVRPAVKEEDKECLASYVSVNGMEAWTLWDSGSTTTGITPTFAQMAEVVVDTLIDPHILQLGTVGSRSIIKYGADVPVTLAGKSMPVYVDIANFDRYDMIMGTPFMRAHGVVLDFVKNQILVDGVAISAVRVNAKGSDSRARRYRATDKHQN